MPNELVVLTKDQLEDIITSAVARAVATLNGEADDRWLSTRDAAKYLDIHPDTLRRAAAERRIDSRQDGPGCKLYFKRSELDAWGG